MGTGEGADAHRLGRRDKDSSRVGQEVVDRSHLTGWKTKK